MSHHTRPAFPPLSKEPAIPVEEARERVLAEVRTVGTERLALPLALGRVIREDVRAPGDLPQRDNSAMDGYAVVAADVADPPVRLRVAEDVPAGVVAKLVVERGSCARIMTGALLPAGADAVVPVESTDAGGDVVEIRAGVPEGANVRRRGEDMRSGDLLIPAGSLLRAAEIGILATARRPFVTVSRRPTVAILSTGDELTEVDEPPEEGKLVNSNGFVLAALAREAGAEPRMLGIVRDSLDETVEALSAALESDFVVTSGGVSVGAFDFVKPALDRLGAETRFWQVAMKPGRPVVLSRLRDRVVFGLPGNPVSSAVSFLLFVAPALRKASGRTEGIVPPVVSVRLGGELRSKGDRRHFLRVRVVAESGALVAHPMKAQGSGVSTSMLGANGLAITDPGDRRFAPGETVPVMLFGPVEERLPAGAIPA